MERRPPAIQHTTDQLPEIFSDRELIVVSNRQPYRHDYADDESDRPTVECPTGGLTAGLDPIMQKVGGLWIAWGDGDGDFDVVDADSCIDVPPEDPTYRLRRIRLSEDEIRDYYYGFSNQSLWPVCHCSLTNVACDTGFWEAFQQVNERFAAAVVDHVEERSLVWFQDYHLALAPSLVRSQLSDDVTLMHFWHIPWPAWDTFRACPHGSEVIRGLLGNDLLGFHLPRYKANFLRCVDTAIDEAVVNWETGEVLHPEGKTTVQATPLGIPYAQIRQAAARSGSDGFRSSLRRTRDIDSDTTIAVGVDRLDYTKGILQRLEALEQFFDTRPEWRGELTYVQNASESRSEIAAYREVQESVAAAVERINGRFATSDWTPVVYETDHLSKEELCGLYRQADLGLVTPIRDGMNLVAQEYVAAQIDDDGVLILSDQAGLHDEVGEHALTVSPFDIQEFTRTIDRALSIPEQERRRRMKMLRRWVATHDLETWFAKNVRAVLPDSAVGEASVQSR